MFGKKKQQQRTSPTVKKGKPAAPEKPRSNTFVSLGPVQLMLVLGVVMGAMVGAFFLGFTSGQKTGYDTALNAALTTTARIPVPDSELDEAASETSTSNVYAKLAQHAEQVESAPIVDPKKEEKLGAAPELAAIPSIDDIPLLPENSEPLKNAVAKAPVGKVAVGTGLTGTSSSEKTLGEIAQERSAAQDRGTKKMELASAAAIEPVTNPSSAAPIAKSAASSVSQKVLSGGNDSPRVASASQSSAPQGFKSPVTAGLNQAGKKGEGVAAKEEVALATAAQIEQKRAGSKSPTGDVAPVAVPPKETDSDDAPPPVRNIVPSGWYVQVAAPRHLQEANQMAAQLKSGGYKVLVEQASVRGDDYFRVIIGPHTQRAQADKILEALKRNPMTKGDPFVRAVR